MTCVQHTHVHRCMHGAEIFFLHINTILHVVPHSTLSQKKCTSMPAGLQWQRLLKRAHTYHIDLCREMRVLRVDMDRTQKWALHSSYRHGLADGGVICVACRANMWCQVACRAKFVEIDATNRSYHCSVRGVLSAAALVCAGVHM